MCKMAKRIKECRLKYGFTQEELADKLGLKKSAIAKYENGRVENIKRTTIEEMANIFECNPSYLMGWDDADMQSYTENDPVAAHKDGENFTPEELRKIEEYKKLLIAARPKE